MKFSNMRVGSRLGLGFAMLLLAVVGVGAVGMWKLSRLNAAVERMTHLDWVKASLAMQVDSLARDNAARTGELLLADEGKAADIRSIIDKNKATITSNLENLAGLLYLPEG